MSRVKTSLQALAIARSTEADEAVLAVYLHNLADLDAALVSQACERLAKLPRKAYEAALPDVGTIRAEVEAIASDDEARDWFEVCGTRHNHTCNGRYAHSLRMQREAVSA